MNTTQEQAAPSSNIFPVLSQRRSAVSQPFLRLLSLLLIFFIYHVPAYSAPPSPDIVFQLQASVADPNMLQLHWNIQPGYYLYKDRLHLTPHGTYQLGTIHFPEAFSKKNALGKIDALYRQDLTLNIPVLGRRGGEATLTIQYQGCAEDGYCYPPQKKSLLLAFNKDKGLFHVERVMPPISQDKPSGDAVPPVLSQTDKITHLFHARNPLFVILIFAGFGLLLACTPCVLPMIPVLSSLIIAHGQNISPQRGFLLSLYYVLGMALTYALLGAIVASFGQNLQLWMQHPLPIGILGGIFVLLACSMFGLFDIQLPASIHTKIVHWTRHKANGHYASAFIMGVLSTLIISPCVTPPLVGALGYMLQQGNPWFASAALFAMGIGLGAPLLILGASAGQWLPKAGAWMSGIKTFFGLVLLALSLSLFARILPDTSMMLLWSALFLYTGVLAILIPLERIEIRSLFMASGLGMTCYGLLLLVGYTLGNTEPLHPIRLPPQHMSVTSASSTVNLRVSSLAALQKTLKTLIGKPIFLDFYADWCTSCQVMEKTLFHNTQVLQSLEAYTRITVDLSANNAASQALMQQFKVVAPPTFIFLNADHDEIMAKRLVGEVSSEQWLKNLSNSSYATGS